jgi:peptidoglycan/xylan/chitin deacetylase (PgdA/CDA1 family)
MGGWAVKPQKHRGLWIVTVGRTEFIVALVVALIIAGGALLVSALGQPRTVMTALGPQPVRRGDAAQASVALMFNVDWGEDVIPTILEILEEGDAKATFFVTGVWARKNPQLLRAIRGEGHEIGLHGDSHRHSTSLDTAQLTDFIKKNAESIAKILGVEPAKLFAPPSGDCDDRVARVAAGLGYVTVLWTHDTVDWKKPPAARIVERVVGRAENGALFLMHPTAPTTEALPAIIRGLKAAGYRIVPVSSLLPAPSRTPR